MNRRRFMKVAGIAGLSVMAPVALRDKEAHASSTAYKGPFWIMVNAAGGWDATMLTDPKGGTAGDASSVDQAYPASAIGKAGNISYAPISYSSNNVLVQSSQAFFEAHHGRLTVINGVDTETNNHDAGTRTTWSGQLAEGYPSFAAMAAAKAAADLSLPLAYVSNGGYDDTAGLISLARVGDPSALEKLAFTNESDPTNATTDKFFTPNTAARIQAAQAGRLQALANKSTLPYTQQAMNTLYLARQSTSGLAALGDQLKGVSLVTTASFPDLNGTQNLGDLTNLMQQAQLALLAFKCGVAVSANLNYGGFDTHSNNDAQQERQISVLLRGLDYLFNQIDAMGMTDNVYVVVGSDFSRTPYYNAGNGKDHWNITSMMFAGPKIQGDRVLGGTDATFTSINLDPMTLQPSTTGERITTTHVHHALRSLAGLTGGPLDTEFPLGGDTMPLFS
jgi:uncharacterized protein (DUF1501 family)